ncbi:MAG: ATP-binding cassette domain-containing protein [Ruminococcus sp.]|nr:ATP-binding cassette domain-containing protein [Ruminococcus sp.]
MIKNFTKKLSHNYVLSDINLELESGKIYGFVGENGSGKTMLMRAICGLILPTMGYVEIDGRIVGKDISFPDNVGVLIENPGFIPGYSGFRNLKVLAQIKNKISNDKITETLEKVGLDPNDKKSFRKYSLGMKQKLGIAAAIMENPELLILDEPFNGLDEDSVNNIRNLIIESKKPNNIIILSCHDNQEIEIMCDEIVEIKLGKIVSIRKSEKWKDKNE